MEPITIATAFASIIGLIRVYKAEASEPKMRDFNQYIDWLRRQEHHQLVEVMLGNAEITKSVRDLIEDQQGEVMAKLEQLDKILAGVARHIETFEPLASAVSTSQLSDQAVSILHQLNQAGSCRFLEIEMMEANEYEMLDKSGEIQVNEPRFIDDDLLRLCELGLLRLSHNSQGAEFLQLHVRERL